MSIYRSIPGAVIAAPKDELELKNMMYSAMLAEKGPYIIRYPRGYGEGVDWQGAGFSALQPGKGECLRKGDTIAVVCAGPVACRATKVADELKEESGWSPSIYNIRYIKPLDTELLVNLCRNYEEIITVEDGTIIGGLYGSVCEYAASLDVNIKIRGIGIPDRYINQATQEEQRSECGLTEERLKSFFEQEIELFSKKSEKVLEIKN
jgi:1-deoxy-D-xylulose-5-phosphate synthase